MIVWPLVYPVTDVDLPTFAQSLYRDSGGCRLYCREDVGNMLLQNVGFFLFFLSIVFKNVLEVFQVVKKGNLTWGKEDTVTKQQQTDPGYLSQGC